MSKTTAPTAASDGVITQTCSKCNQVKTIHLPSLSKGSYTVKSTVAPTCVKAGSTEYQITISGTSYFVTVVASATGKHSYVNGVCKTCSVSAPDYTSHTTHVYGAWGNSATEHRHTCTIANCNVEEKAAYSLDGGVETTAATCTENGEKTYTCSVCRAEKTATEPAAGHKYATATITVAATCTKAGEQTSVCGVCKNVKTEVIAATGHSFGAWQNKDNIQHIRTCSSCKTIESANHDFTVEVCGKCNFRHNSIAIGGLIYKIVNPQTRANVRALNTSNVNGHAVVLGFSGTPMATLDIPQTITSGGTVYPVTEIGAGAFKNSTILENLTYSDDLVIIGEEAFCGSSIRYVNKPASDYESDLKKLQVLGNRAFKDSRLCGVMVPETLVDVGVGAFENTNMSHAEIHCATIGTDMFKNTQLSTVVIGNEVQVIKSGAFIGCNFDGINWYCSHTAPKLQTIESKAFESNSQISNEYIVRPQFSFGGRKSYWDSVNKATDWIVGGSYELIAGYNPAGYGSWEAYYKYVNGVLQA